MLERSDANPASESARDMYCGGNCNHFAALSFYAVRLLFAAKAVVADRRVGGAGTTSSASADSANCQPAPAT